jgi:hypothetical protein
LEAAAGVYVNPECLSDNSDNEQQQHYTQYNAEHTTGDIRVKSEICDDNEQQYWADDNTEHSTNNNRYVKAEMLDDDHYMKAEQFDDSEQQQCAICNSTYCTCDLNDYAHDDSGSDSDGHDAQNNNGNKLSSFDAGHSDVQGSAEGDSAEGKH